MCPPQTVGDTVLLPSDVTGSSTISNPFNLKNIGNAAKNYWPWIVGAVVIAGAGYYFYKKGKLPFLK